MIWKLGWLISSLKYHVEKDIRDTLCQNEVFLRNRWSPLERMVIWGAKHIFLTILLLLLTASLFFNLVATNYAVIKQLFPVSLNGLSPIIEFQSTIFGAQVTLLGLIFPLVIALIGFLLQGKSSNESMWTVYRHNSGFMLVGFSSLTLSLCFVLLKFYEPWLSYQFNVAASISVIWWFIINLLLIFWFLNITVAFLSLNSRMEMIVKYAINEVVPSDIKKRLFVHHCVSASKTGLLLSPQSNELEVNTFSAKDLPNKISHSFAKPKVISNIWYRILNVGVWLWTVQVRLQKIPDQKLILCLPFSTEGDSQREILLAKTNSDKVNFISEFLIRASVKTSSQRDKSSLNIKQMIGALFGQIEDSLKENNSRLFDSAKENLVQFHREIESSMYFINCNGEPDNWLLLPEGKWFGRSFLDVFVKESSSIAKKVTRRIQDDANYYESWCYLYPLLFRSQKTNIPVRVAKSYIDGHYLIWGRLMSWMGGFNQSDFVSVQQRDRAIKHFVGSWEHWNNLLNSDIVSVNDNEFFVITHHLANTSCMIIHASKYDNLDAAKWATDVLVHWFDLFSDKQLGYHYYGWHHELITPDTLRLASNHALFTSISCNNDFRDVEATKVALRNYWTDIRCLTAAYLLVASQHKEGNEKKQLIDALISGARLEPTGNIEDNHAPITSAKDILGVYLRQNGFWDGQSDYSTILEHHIDILARIEEPEWVSGRIYSSSGTKKDLYLLKFFKVFGVGLTSDKFKIDQKWLDFFKSDAISQANLETTISELRKLLIIDDSIISLVSEHFNIERAECKEKSELFIDSIEGAISELESKISSQIINAQIDENRLRQFGIAASGSNFTLTDGPMPIFLFHDIGYIDNFDADVVVTNIVDYRKSEVSQGIEVNRAINEEEWLNNIVSQRATTAAFQQLLKKCSWKEAKFEDAKSLILKAVEDSQSLKSKGLSPILFIGPWDVYQLIDSSKWHYGRDEDRLPLDISVESDKGDGYICHIAGIEIYRLPFSKADFSILLCKETFKKINIKRFGDGLYVNVTFKTKNDTDITGTLSLSFGIECEFDVQECFKYVSLNPDD